MSHALFSPSSAYRWLTCTASVLATKDIKDTEASDAAKEGTVAHALCELKVKNYFHKDQWTDEDLAKGIKMLSEEPLWDKEMLEYSEVYLEEVKKAAMEFDHEPWVDVETRVDIFENCFGTADCILVGGNTLHVIDFKYGKSPVGRVEAERNPQMMLYANGAYKKYHMLYAIEKIKMTIVQPRLTDGITHYETDVNSLFDFAQQAQARAKEALSGRGVYAPSEKSCRFCKIRATCRARAEKITGPFKNHPDVLLSSEVAEYIKLGTEISSWLNDIKSIALSACLKGDSIPGLKAVEGRKTRVWTDADKAFQALIAHGIQEELLYERVPLSIAKVEKLVGKKEFSELMKDYVTQKAGAPTLAEESDKRPAITNQISAKTAFFN